VSVRASYSGCSASRARTTARPAKISATASRLIARIAKSSDSVGIWGYGTYKVGRGWRLVIIRGDADDGPPVEGMHGYPVFRYRNSLVVPGSIARLQCFPNGRSQRLNSEGLLQEWQIVIARNPQLLRFLLAASADNQDRQLRPFLPHL
jgi:hypothetical protein